MGLATNLFDYELPPELIAQRPAERRDQSRMMTLDRRNGSCEILPFPAVTDFLESGDLLLYNDTRVMRARMYGRREGLADGAKFELLLISPLDRPERWNVLLKPGKRAKIGTVICLTDQAGNISTDGLTVEARREDGSFDVCFNTSEIERLQTLYGHIPLPPYIHRGDENADSERYQTIFARQMGAVAAPTAGLHFTPEVLETLSQKNVRQAAVTLHVGPGTFKPVDVADVAEHKMHSEHFILSEETAELINRTHAEGHRVMAVGTTTVRVLESCVDEKGKVLPRQGETSIFLYPPYRPKAVDLLLTNFHLPQSTLLMLVSTFADREKVLAAYEMAIREKMRFYSYGDCMLLHLGKHE